MQPYVCFDPRRLARRAVLGKDIPGHIRSTAAGDSAYLPELPRADARATLYIGRRRPPARAEELPALRAAQRGGAPELRHAGDGRRPVDLPRPGQAAVP